MNENKGHRIKWICFALMVIVAVVWAYHGLAGEYEDPAVAIEVNSGDTYKYGDTIEVEVQLTGADSCDEKWCNPKPPFKATEPSYTLQGGANGVKWHYTYPNGYVAPQGPADLDADPITIPRSCKDEIKALEKAEKEKDQALDYYHRVHEVLMRYCQMLWMRIC